MRDRLNLGSITMKRQVIILITVALYVKCDISNSSAYPQKAARHRQAYAADQILVKLRLNAIIDKDQIQVAEAVLPTRSTRAERLSPKDEDDTYVIHLRGNVTAEEAIAEARRDPRVEYAEPNYLYYPADTIPNDGFFDQMWGLQNSFNGHGIGAARAWDITTGADDVVAAVLDTGIDLSHEDLVPNSWVNPFELPGNGIDDDGNGYVDDINGWNFLSNGNQVFANAQEDFHGTHVAGTIGGAGNNGIGIVGVAWHVRLMSLKFMGRRTDGTIGGSTADAVRAIKYAIDLKNRGINIRAINASWSGTSASETLRSAIRKAGKVGILFVCAAGNGGTDGRGDDIDEFPEFPAAWNSEMNSLISVTALNSSGSLESFSNYGHNAVSVGAPGVSIISTLPGNSYGYLSGTSMATPHVTGISILLASHEPELSAAQIKQRIVSAAEPVLTLACRSVSAGNANAHNTLLNRISVPQGPAINRVQSSKKVLTIDGLGFFSGSSVIEINGVAVTDAEYSYDASYALASGTFTRLEVRLGKPRMKEVFPSGQSLTVAVYNPTTGQRSASVNHVRF